MKRIEDREFWPELVSNMNNMSFRELSEKYGVSHGAIAAAIKRNGIKREPAPPGPRSKRDEAYANRQPAPIANAKAPAKAPAKEPAKAPAKAPAKEPAKASAKAPAKVEQGDAKFKTRGDLIAEAARTETNPMEAKQPPGWLVLTDGSASFTRVLANDALNAIACVTPLGRPIAVFSEDAVRKLLAL